MNQEEDHRNFDCKQEESVKRMEQLKKVVHFQFRHPLFNDFYIKPDQYIELVPTEEQ